MAERKGVRVLQRIFWGLFLFCFAVALAGCFTDGASLPGAGLLLAAIVALVWAAQSPRVPQKALLALFLAGLACTVAVQVWLAFNHYIVPRGFDMEAVYTAVKEIAENGHMVESDWYFVGQPYQSFILVELYVFSHILMLFGAPTPLPYQAFTLLNALGIDLSILLFMAAVRVAKGNRPALGVGLVCLLLSPLRYASVYVYTHMLAFPYLFAAIFFVTLAAGQAKRPRRILFFALGAALLSLGALMAGSVLIVFVALVILAVLAGNWKRWLAGTGILLGVYLVVNTVFYLVGEQRLCRHQPQG